MADSNSTSTSAKQHPALIVGLGGTGKQVLLNLRRMFYERYGVATPPHVAHLWIDTDTRNRLLDGREMDFLMKEVDFKESEKVATELRPSDLANYYDHPEAHPHIFSWFDKRLTKHGHIPDGAGGIRSFGRLAFFRYYEDIMTRLREKRAELERAVSHNESQNELGIDLDASQVDFWLVFSVAGGTGSGMFLDLSFAMRDMWPDIRTRGVIVLPSVFSNNTQDRFFGNAYASLMELEHYTYGKDEGSGPSPGSMHRFPVAWTRDMYLSKQRTMPGPVFDMVYLMGNRPASALGALSLEDKDALCRMIAESLYIEYATGKEVESLASERRSSQVNFSVALSRIVSYDYQDAARGLRFKDDFSCRYSSFGLSKVFIPVGRVEVVVHHRLARDLVAFWSGPQTVPTNLDELLDRDYCNRIGVDNGGKNRNFIRALDSTGDGDRLVNRLRNQFRSEKRNNLLAMAGAANVRGAISQWMDEVLQTQLERAHANRERWGSMAKSLRQNADSHYDKVKQRLNELVADILGQPGQRFDVARETLRRIRDRLLRDEDRFEKAQLNHRNAANRAQQDAQTRLQWLDDVKGGFTRRVVVDVVLEDMEDRMVRELQAQVMGEAAALADRLADYIGRGQKEKNADGEEVIVETGLIKQLVDFQDHLQGEVMERLSERLEALAKPQPSPIYQDLGEGEQEVARFYVDAQRSPVVESTLSEWEQRFFEDQAPQGPTSLWELKDTLSDQGVASVIERLLRFSRSTMRHIQEQTVDVLNRLTEKHKPDSPQYGRVIENLLGYAQPWLAKPGHFVDGNDNSSKIQHKMWIALSESARSEERKSFEAALGHRSAEKYQLVGGAADRIYAYSEKAGVPLMVVPDLNRYRNDSYYPLLEQDEVLHTDVAFEKFQDLLIMEPDEVADYLNAMEVFLQALALGVVTTRQEILKDSGEVLGFVFRTKDGLFEKNIDLGAFSVAVRRLARHTEKDLLERIRGVVGDRIGAMYDDTMTKWYALLSYHAEAPESYFSRFPEEHVVRAVFRREAEKVRERVPHVVEGAEAELGNIKHWSGERPTGSGLRTLRTED